MKQILPLLCTFLILILEENYVKSLKVTRIVKQIESESDWGELEAKYCIERQSGKLSFDFMSSLRVPIFKDSQFLVEIYLIILKTRARSNLKGFQHQIWSSLKRSKK